MPSIVSPSVEVNGQAKSSTLSRPSTTDPETDSGKRRKAVSTFETNLADLETDYGYLTPSNC